MTAGPLWQPPLSEKILIGLCRHVTFLGAVWRLLTGVGRVPQGPLEAFSASSPARLLCRCLPGFGIYRAELGFLEALSSLAEKLPSSSLLHKATLFSANPPRSGTHFFQMIQQHVNGKGRT